MSDHGHLRTQRSHEFLTAEILTHISFEGSHVDLPCKCDLRVSGSCTVREPSQAIRGMLWILLRPLETQLPFCATERADALFTCAPPWHILRPDDSRS